MKYNLDEGGLKPESLEWRESNFQLGRVLFQHAAMLETESKLKVVEREDPQNDDPAIAAAPPDKDQAIDKLKKSHERFRQSISELERALTRENSDRISDKIPTIEYRYLLAEANRRSATWPRQRSQRVSFPDDKKGLIEDAIEFYQKAHVQFDALVDDLSKLADDKELTEIESNILRNAYFARGDTLYELAELEVDPQKKNNKYDEAVEAYRSAAFKYQRQPESLEAFFRTASCYRKMNLPSRARTALGQAKRFIDNQIPMDADYKNTTRYSRDEWLAYLDVLDKL